jgi:hypothetical protein
MSKYKLKYANTKIEQMDSLPDYGHKLNEYETAWLSLFLTEYVNGNCPKNKSDNLNNTDALRKDCYLRNNASNRCVMSRAKARNLISYDEEFEGQSTDHTPSDYGLNTVEDAMLEYLDSKKKH